MSEKKQAIVWRESVYKSGHCPRCGARLISEKNEPLNIYYDLSGPHGDKVLCTGCKLHVANIRPYEGPAKPGERAGKWLEENISVRMYAVAVSGAEMFSLLMMQKEALEKLMVHSSEWVEL